MADERYLDILKEDVEVWNMWRASNNHKWIIELEEANFENQNLDYINFNPFINRSYLAPKGKQASFRCYLIMRTLVIVA